MTQRVARLCVGGVEVLTPCPPGAGPTGRMRSGEAHARTSHTERCRPTAGSPPELARHYRPPVCLVGSRSSPPQITRSDIAILLPTR